MLMMELKNILTEKYTMSANWPAMSDASMNANGRANNLWSTPTDHAMILMGLGRKREQKVIVQRHEERLINRFMVCCNKGTSCAYRLRASHHPATILFEAVPREHVPSTQQYEYGKGLQRLIRAQEYTCGSYIPPGVQHKYQVPGIRSSSYRLPVTHACHMHF